MAFVPRRVPSRNDRRFAPGGLGRAGADHGKALLFISLLCAGTALLAAPAGSGKARPPAAVPPTNTGPPVVAGVPQVGQKLHPANGVWQGTNPLTFSFLWQRCDRAATGCTTIAGATGYDYTAFKNDIGARLRVVVTARNSAGSASAVSAPSDTITAPTSATAGAGFPQALPPPPTNVGPRGGAAVCSGAIVDTSTDLAAAVAAHGPGTTFCITRGVHRMKTQVVPRPNDRFIGEPGAILNGAEDITARLVQSVVASRPVWIATGRMEQETLLKGTCDSPAYSGCKYAHDVYFDDRALARAMSLSELRSGTFFFDYGAHVIYIADDPRGHKVEIAVSPGAFQGWQTGGTGVTVRGLTVEKFANQAQTGAISCGLGWTVEDNDVRLNHGAGMYYCDVVRYNFVHHNGQLGLGEGKLAEYNELAFNNTARFSPRWEAGGVKFTLTTGLIVRGNYSHDNNGPGLWTDGDNIKTTYEDNYVANNGYEGIVHEISYDVLIRNNIVVNNGFSTSSGWLDGAGILIEASPNAEVVGNLVVGNWNGIGITQAARGSGMYGPHEVHDVRVHDNVVVMQRGQSGMAQGVNDPSYFTTRNNRFAHNTYYIGCISHPFAWRSPRSRDLDGRLTLTDWAVVGNDRDGLIVSTCRG